MLLSAEILLILKITLQNAKNALQFLKKPFICGRLKALLPSKTSDGAIDKGAKTFLSEDKEHSHQQIQQFEHRMFEIFRENFQHPLNHRICYTDGCGAQCKSEYVIADMLCSSERYQVKTVSFNYFESHEYKGCSDSIGSIVKCSFSRGILSKLSRMSPSNSPRNLNFS